MNFQRYAIYATPEGALAQAGAGWLGWDIHTGTGVAHPDGLDLAAVTARPRRYGLHATIKPPLRLAAGRDANGLTEAAREIAATLSPVTLEGLQVAQLGRFLALRPVGPTAALDAMAARVVRDIDGFRAPASQEELERRRGRLSPRQEENLTRWGYPHVMEDFRFHITLTGPLSEPDVLRARAEAYFAPVLPRPFAITNLTLVGEDPEGFFHAVERLPLGGS